MSTPQFPKFVFGKNDASDPSGAWFQTATQPTWEGTTDQARIVVSDVEPDNGDGRPDGTFYFQIPAAA